MWLLNTYTLRLHYFVSPEVVQEGYVILSHVWGENEESFQDIQNIHSRCAISGRNPHDLVSLKITKLVEIARHHGYAWAWIDTCCIDKTSSAELSEAINSMFRYYSLALVCYAFLHDVDTDRAFRVNTFSGVAGMPFARSRWHRRGWTLQELIAPRVVLFLSSSWELLGSKSELVDVLTVVTQVPATILLFEQSVTEMSVAQRMSWAAMRETTRLEDEAYCLLGILDISMPTLYGEGRKAFRRLQEEIMRQSWDTTIFAWGPQCSLSKLASKPSRSLQRAGLFSTSPSDFSECYGIELRSDEPQWTRSDDCMVDIPIFTTMPNAVNARIPIVNIDGRIYADLSWSICGDPLLLLLHSRLQPTTSTAQMYDVGGCVRFPSGADESITPVWNNIRISNYTNLPQPTSALYFPMNHGFYPAVRIPERVIRAFLDKVGAKNASVTNAHLEWSGSPPTSVTFKWKPRATGALLLSTPLALNVGRCRVDSGGCEEHLGPLWANIRRKATGGSNQTSSYARDGRDDHACPADHILTWPSLKKRFSVKMRIGRLRYDCAFNLVFVQDSSITLADCLTLAEISVTTDKSL